MIVDKDGYVNTIDLADDLAANHSVLMASIARVKDKYPDEVKELLMIDYVFLKGARTKYGYRFDKKALMFFLGKFKKFQDLELVRADANKLCFPK